MLVIIGKPSLRNKWPAVTKSEYRVPPKRLVTKNNYARILRSNDERQVIDAGCWTMDVGLWMMDDG